MCTEKQRGDWRNENTRCKEESGDEGFCGLVIRLQAMTLHLTSFYSCFQFLKLRALSALACPGVVIVCFWLISAEAIVGLILHEMVSDYD